MPSPRASSSRGDASSLRVKRQMGLARLFAFGPVTGARFRGSRTAAHGRGAQPADANLGLNRLCGELEVQRFSWAARTAPRRDCIGTSECRHFLPEGTRSRSAAPTRSPACVLPGLIPFDAPSQSRGRREVSRPQRLARNPSTRSRRRSAARWYPSQARCSSG